MNWPNKSRKKTSTFFLKKSQIKKIFKTTLRNYLHPGADLGGGGEQTPSPSGIRPPLPFDTFSEIHFWPTDPKIFLKAPLAPIYTNFEGERAPKKNAIFLSKFFKKCPKRLFWLFFQKNCLRRRKFSQNRGKTVLQCFGRARKINLVDLKKKRSTKFWNFFWKSAPPLEKILDPSLPAPIEI